MPVARGTTLVALLVLVPLSVGVFVNAGVPVQAPSFLVIYVGIGISLVVHNLDARRAGLLQGVLPWLGSVTGVAVIFAGIGSIVDILRDGECSVRVPWKGALMTTATLAMTQFGGGSAEPWRPTHLLKYRCTSSMQYNPVNW